MATKKITDLVEITTAASDDVLPIVDVSLDITNKITTTNLLKSKQDLLESGTNIKTINSTSLLGSGDISISANPSGGAGLIQFSDGSAFASDSNLFWDNTNKRLGVGTSSPTSTLYINGLISAGITNGINIQGANSNSRIYLNDNQGSEISYINLGFSVGVGINQIGGNTTIGDRVFRNGVVNLNARLGIKGSGSTSATTALLVQNSSGAEAFKIQDNRTAVFGGIVEFQSNTQLRGANDSGSSALNLRFVVTGASKSFLINADYSNTNDPSALLEVQSTTKGFLPPKMTTTQKNAISSPAAGLQVYDTTLNQMSYYNGTSWINF